MPYADYQQHLRCNRERQKTPAGKENHARANQAYRERNRKKMRAHNLLNKAISRGKMFPMPCLVCGNDASEAHHADYDNPLGVTWLCDPHHKEVHQLTKQLKAAA